MSEGEIIPKSDLQENQDINTSQPANIISNNQNPQEDKNNISNNSLPKEDLKFGQYLLTPLQSILLNKKFPSGFKLETEENILKSLEMIKAQEKKHKQAQKNNLQKAQRNSNNKFGQPNKKIKNNNNIDNIPNNMNPEKYKIIIQCKGGFEKIKESKYFSKYYISSDPNIPSLSNIEKKLNNFEYSSLYDFEMDVRNIWNYYFNLNSNDEIVKKMSEDWEKICTDLENPNSQMSVTDIKKRTDNIKKDLQNYKDHREDIAPVPTKKSPAADGGRVGAARTEEQADLAAGSQNRRGQGALDEGLLLALQGVKRESALGPHQQAVVEASIDVAGAALKADVSVALLVPQAHIAEESNHPIRI